MPEHTEHMPGVESLIILLKIARERAKFYDRASKHYRKELLKQRRSNYRGELAEATISRQPLNIVNEAEAIYEFGLEGLYASSSLKFDYQRFRSLLDAESLDHDEFFDEAAVKRYRVEPDVHASKILDPERCETVFRELETVRKQGDGELQKFLENLKNLQSGTASRLEAR